MNLTEKLRNLDKQMHYFINYFRYAPNILFVVLFEMLFLL